MVQFGLDLFLQNIPNKIKGKRVGVVCHAASITSSYSHILDVFMKVTEFNVSAVFGPQHGLFGQTQDNMVEWGGGFTHPEYNIPVYSLYGDTRKPNLEMLGNVEALVIDLQDVGARPYTYIWTIKLCMEACLEKGIPVWILDRPNPVAALPFDGPMLKEEYYSFVGGAKIPLCHRMTMGEIALLIKELYYKKLELSVIWMEEWQRDSLYDETGLPWVIPSPNMPSLNTAIVYPGMVLFEATNVSEGRGSTIPFELFGAPYIKLDLFKKDLFGRELPGCIFREHNFIPTFQKWQGEYCYGMQIHVTNPRLYQSVYTAASILDSIIKTSQNDSFIFKEPPYEYEYKKMPFDILAGDTTLRESLISGDSLEKQQHKWQEDIEVFKSLFTSIAHYSEN